jgi:hypothetical protein
VALYHDLAFLQRRRTIKSPWGKYLKMSNAQSPGCPQSIRPLAVILAASLSSCAGPWGAPTHVDLSAPGGAVVVQAEVYLEPCSYPCVPRGGSDIEITSVELPHEANYAIALAEGDCASMKHVRILGTFRGDATDTVRDDTPVRSLTSGRYVLLIRNARHSDHNLACGVIKAKWF